MKDEAIRQYVSKRGAVKVVAMIGEYPLRGTVAGFSEIGLPLVHDPRTGYDYAVLPEQIELEA